MIRKTIISSIIFLSISNNSFAKQGAYVGGSIGALGYSQLYGTHFTGGVFAGYGKTLDQQARFYLGGELGLNVTYGVHNTYYMGTRMHHSHTDLDVSASILPGLMLTKDTLLYGRLGLNVSRPISNYYSFGPVYGIGIQHNFTEHVAVRAEYDMNANGGKKHQGSIGLVYSFG